MQRRTFFRAGLAAGAVGIMNRRVVAQPTRCRLHCPAPDPLRLNFNENPLGLSPAARRAVVDGIVEGNRYPGAAAGRLIRALAQHHEVGAENVVLGAGSTDILRMAVQASTGPGARMIVADPTFEDVPSYAERFGIEAVKVPLTGDHAHDLSRMRQAAESSRTPALVFLCNPNNPTGTLTSCDAIDAWIGEAPDHVRFVIDEAYFEYVEDGSYRTSVPWIARRPNVIVARTFSKIYGMAGMRVGYGLAHAETARLLRAHQGRNNVGYLSLVAALASLHDAEYAIHSRTTNSRARTVLLNALRELDIEALPSHTNFVMHRVRGDLLQYVTRMRSADVQVGRPFPPMLHHNRVSLGLPEEMEQFVEILRSFRTRGWL